MLLFPTRMRQDYLMLAAKAAERCTLVPDRVPRTGPVQRNRTGWKFTPEPTFRNRWETAEGDYTASLRCRIWRDAHVNDEFYVIHRVYGKVELELTVHAADGKPRFSVALASSYSTIESSWTRMEEVPTMTHEGWHAGCLTQGRLTPHEERMAESVQDDVLHIPWNPHSGRRLYCYDGRNLLGVPRDAVPLIAANAVAWLSHISER
jgi:hypothetical protein